MMPNACIDCLDTIAPDALRCVVCFARYEGIDIETARAIDADEVRTSGEVNVSRLVREAMSRFERGDVSPATPILHADCCDRHHVSIVDHVYCAHNDKDGDVVLECVQDDLCATCNTPASIATPERRHCAWSSCSRLFVVVDEEGGHTYCPDCRARVLAAYPVATKRDPEVARTRQSGHRLATSYDRRDTFGRDLHECAECGDLVEIPHIASCCIGDLCHVCSPACRDAHQATFDYGTRVCDACTTGVECTSHVNESSEVFAARASSTRPPLDAQTLAYVMHARSSIVEAGDTIDDTKAIGTRQAYFLVRRDDDTTFRVTITKES